MFASPIDVPTIRRLADEFPRVIGIKDSTGDLAFMMRLIIADPPRAPGLHLPYRLGSGAGPHADDRLRRRHACFVNVVPEVTRRIYDLYRAGDTDAAMKLAVPSA